MIIQPAMRPAETAAALAALPGRTAGTDAERRAAAWLAGEIRAAGRTARLETFWCRPNWALAQAWHCVPAIVGSVVAVHHPRLGGALLLASLVCVLADALAGVSPGRLLTRERASQNVVSPPPEADTGRLRLVVTAAYDAPRAGLARRAATRAGLRRLAAVTPGWAAWIAVELVWLLAVAVVRNSGSAGTALGVIQLIPTAALVIEAALLLDQATAAASDTTSGAAVALALTRALDAAPPRRLAIELVLQGAGTFGLRRHLRKHRRKYTAGSTIVLGIADGGAGRPAFWVRDGLLRLHPRLRRLAQQAGAVPHSGRGASLAFSARIRGLPALTLGCISDRPATSRDPRAMDALLQAALMLVDALDAELAGLSDRAGAAPAAA